MLRDLRDQILRREIKYISDNLYSKGVGHVHGSHTRSTYTIKSLHSSKL